MNYKRSSSAFMRLSNALVDERRHRRVDRAVYNDVIDERLPLTLSGQCDTPNKSVKTLRSNITHARWIFGILSRLFA